MRRRELIAAAGFALIAPPFAARAQQQSPLVVGFFHSAALATREKQVAAFREGLAETGYIEGRSVVTEFRWADGDYDRLPELASDLVRRQVALIAAPTLPSALAAKRRRQQ